MIKNGKNYISCLSAISCTAAFFIGAASFSLNLSALTAFCLIILASSAHFDVIAARTAATVHPEYFVTTSIMSATIASSKAGLGFLFLNAEIIEKP